MTMATVQNYCVKQEMENLTLGAIGESNPLDLVPLRVTSSPITAAAAAA